MTTFLTLSLYLTKLTLHIEICYQSHTAKSAKTFLTVQRMAQVEICFIQLNKGLKIIAIEQYNVQISSLQYQLDEVSHAGVPFIDQKS